MRLLFTKKGGRLELFVALVVGMVLGFGLMALVASFVVVRAATSSSIVAPVLGNRSASQHLDHETGGQATGPSSPAYRPGAAGEILGEFAEATIPPTVAERKKCALCTAVRRALGSVRKISLAK